jgi:hypothetical protein
MRSASAVTVISVGSATAPMKRQDLRGTKVRAGGVRAGHAERDHGVAVRLPTQQPRRHGLNRVDARAGQCPVADVHKRETKVMVAGRAGGQVVAGVPDR